MIEALLNSGADIDAQGDYHPYFSSREEPYRKCDWTPLMQAAYSNAANCAKLLLRRSTKTYLKDSKGRTAFQIALLNKDGEPGREEIIRLLADATPDGKAWVRSAEGQEWFRSHEVDPTAPFGLRPAEAWTTLQSALDNGEDLKHQEIIRWIESGGDVNWRCSVGMTVLHYAAMRGNYKMVLFLLEHGAQIDTRAGNCGGNRTPLLWACANIQTSVIPILLDHGADPNAKDSEGYTSLELIRQSGLEEAKKMAELLATRGAKLVPGKTSTCPECGAPETVRMRERGVQVTFNGVSVGLACPGCSKEQEIPLHAIDKARGSQVLCPSCGAIAFVPAPVWCRTCGVGLSSGWQKQISSSRAQVR